MLKDNDLIYITGHQHPDSDSIVSAIAYAFFKKATGFKAVPCRLGSLSHETKYLLERFGFEEPMLLEDARKTLAEIDYDSPEYIEPDTTVLETIKKMQTIKRNSLAVLNEDKTIAGFVSKSDLANIGLDDTASSIELLKQTPVEDIAKCIDGEIIYNDEKTHINGKTSIIAMATSGTENYEIEDRIVIVGNDEKAQEEIIKKGAGLLITVWSENIGEKVIKAAKEYHCPIIKSGHGSMNTSRYLFFAPPVKLIMTENPVTLKYNTLVEDASEKMLKSRFRSYPIVDSENKLLGYVSRYHILNHKRKKIILVDHNEFSQSVRAVESAQILEVIDHHRINDFATSQPVSFRNEIVGSTATIIATMYRENQIPIPKEIASILLGAIISDTLVLQSPTTTQKDIDVANILAALADLEIETFAKDIFTAGSDIEELTMHELIKQDIKAFDINGTKSMISQIIVPSIDAFKQREDELNEEMEIFTKKKNLDLLIVAITSIIDKGSVFYATGDKSQYIVDAFPNKNNEEHSFQEDILSRKSQILPRITEALM